MAEQFQSDAIYIKQAREGDLGAFNFLVSKYRIRVKRIVLYILQNEGDAEDAVQETFLRAYISLDSFRGDSAFFTWIFRIAVNVAKNAYNSSALRLNRIVVNSNDADDYQKASEIQDIDTPENILATKKLAAAITSAMVSLPEPLKDALVLRELEGLDYNQIAYILECPIGTVRSRIFRARNIIAAAILPHVNSPLEKRW